MSDGADVGESCCPDNTYDVSFDRNLTEPTADAGWGELLWMERPMVPM
jgi:hypothetical protein